MKKPKLSIVILNFNTKEFLENCLLSLVKVKNEVESEIIVIDNASTDGSQYLVRKKFPWVKLIVNKKNLGFAKGNNKAKDVCRGRYVLFLNSDTLVNKDTLKNTVSYLDLHQDVGVLSCKILLPNGDLDKDARRKFITPWIGFVHLLTGLDKLFPNSRLFGQYWYGWIPADIEHEIDVAQGAFFLTRRKVLDEVGWFDEDYFLDGEDVDLCWRIKMRGWKIVYYPNATIIHFKGVSKGKSESSKVKVSLEEKLRFRMAGVESMEIFYRKRLWKRYPLVVNYIVVLGIRLMRLKRFFSTLLFG